MILAFGISLAIAAVKIVDFILVKTGALSSGGLGVFGSINSQLRLVLTADVMQWLRNTCSIMYFFFPKPMIITILSCAAALLVIRIALSLFNLIWP